MTLTTFSKLCLTTSEDVAAFSWWTILLYETLILLGGIFFLLKYLSESVLIIESKESSGYFSGALDGFEKGILYYLSALVMFLICVTTYFLNTL